MDGGRATCRRYRDGTLVLETEFDTVDGSVKIIDFMPIRDRTVDVIRIVEGVRGEVPMRMHLTIRFGYGEIVPWVRKVEGALTAVAGPDALVLYTPVETHGVDYSTVAEFTVSRGERVPFSLAWYASHLEVARPRDATRVSTPHGVVVAPLVAEVQLRGRLARRGAAVGDHTEGAHVRAERAGSLPRQPHRFPSGSGACATGTTDSAGSATQPSHFSR